MMTSANDVMERGFAIYLDRTRRLGKEPRYPTQREWEESPAGVRYAAAHGMAGDGDDPAPQARLPEPRPATERAGVTMDDLLRMMAVKLLEERGLDPDMLTGALAPQRTRPEPQFVQGFQPRNAPALPAGFTYGRCTRTRRGVPQVTIRVPFDRLLEVADALNALA